MNYNNEQMTRAADRYSIDQINVLNVNQPPCSCSSASSFITGLKLVGGAVSAITAITAVMTGVEVDC